MAAVPKDETWMRQHFADDIFADPISENLKDADATVRSSLNDLAHSVFTSGSQTLSEAVLDLRHTVTQLA